MLALLLHWVSRSSHLPFAHELIDKIHDRAQYASNSGLVVFDGESRKRDVALVAQDKTPRRPYEEMCASTLGTPINIRVKIKKFQTNWSVMVNRSPKIP
jgi:hypothetical protein